MANNILDIKQNFCPYKRKTLQTTIQLEAKYLSHNYKQHIGQKLEEKILKKCNDDFYIAHIYDYEIEKYGDIIAENECKIMFTVNYDCLLCLPEKGQHLIAKIDCIQSKLILARNGPIIVTIKFKNIIGYNFNTYEDEIFFNKELVKKGDFIKVNINDILIGIGKSIISTTGFLVDMANENDIKEFETSQNHKNYKIENDIETESDDEFI